MKLPSKIGPIHFIGIGGIGMSGIAEVLINLGYTVQGSDASESANVKRLREKGARVSVGHTANALGDAAVVVVSTAIKRDNPELIAARAKRLPVVRRAEMLAELMRLKSCVAIGGTHGKTTTTSLVAALVDAGGFDPTVINGGIINAYGTNARLGAGEWMVVEADESDGTFLKLPADVAIVTNVDPEHLDHFKTFEAVQEAFHAFVENVPFYGFAVMCTDHSVVQLLVGQITDRRIITYGENPQADVRLVGLDHSAGESRFSVVFRDRAGATMHEIDGLRLPMPGRHNALNATAAIAIAHELGVSGETIRTAFAKFGGVRRRFTRTGIWNGVIIVDDYGHHPVEIAAVLRAARESTKGRVIAVVQPHRFTRLAALFDQFCTCFNDADTVIVAHVYPAGEPPIAGIDRDALVQGLRTHGHHH
ncbi:MAG: UDP-N-acetylmuramate--L-alanine ligase, partial [Xanthobacteraceae bacterium]